MGDDRVGRLDGDLQLSARVSVGFASTFDAGVLLLYAGEPAWAKLCFELSPDGRPMVVSVVTRDLSDDANAFAVEAEEIWLRISRIGAASAFHASQDGRRWELIRHFALGADAELGFLAQSPTEVLELLRDLPEEERRAAGLRARDRILAEHTAAHRAAELESHVEALRARRRS